MNKLAIIILGILFSSSVFAKKYGLAGCGLGSILVGKEGDQVIAATTNGSSGSQGFGITSGTSNCVDDEKRKVSLLPYIQINKVQLLNAMAKGSGESLTGLAQLMGCSEQDSFNILMKKNYSDVSKNSDSTENLTDKIYQIIKTNSHIKENCSIFG